MHIKESVRVSTKFFKQKYISGEILNSFRLTTDVQSVRPRPRSSDHFTPPAPATTECPTDQQTVIHDIVASQKFSIIFQLLQDLANNARGDGGEVSEVMSCYVVYGAWWWWWGEWGDVVLCGMARGDGGGVSEVMSCYVVWCVVMVVGWARRCRVMWCGVWWWWWGERGDVVLCGVVCGGECVSLVPNSVATTS